MKNNEIILEELKDVYEDLKYLEKLDDKILTAKLAKFQKEAPKKPIKQIATFYEPEIDFDLKPDYVKWFTPVFGSIGLFVLAMLMSSVTPFFSVAMILLSFVGIVLGLLYVIKMRVYEFPKLRESNKIRMQNTPEYQRKIKINKEDQENRQKLYDSEYHENLRIYNKEKKMYDDEKREFEEFRATTLSELDSLYEGLVCDIRRKFNTIECIPKKYQTLEALEYIIDILSTSNMDVRFALDSYDRDVQRRLTEEQNQSIRYMNDLQEEYNSEMRYQSALQEDANDIADRARKQSNLLHVAHMAQEHKYHKETQKQLDKLLKS